MPASSESKQESRIRSVDGLRTLAILMMVLTHVVLYLSEKSPGYPSITKLFVTYMGIIPAPLFGFVLGMGQFLSLRKQKSNHVWNYYAGRGAALFVIGIAFSALLWGPTNLFLWDILTFLAGSIWIVYLLRGAKDVWIVVLAVGVVLAAPELRELVGYKDYWDPVSHDFIPSFGLTYNLIGFSVTGYFPLIPWMFFPLVGFVVARRSFGGRVKQTSVTLMILGCLSLLLAFLLPDRLELLGIGTIDPVRSFYPFYPLSEATLLIQLGLVLIFFVTLHQWWDGSPATRGWHRYVERVSRYSLTVYVVHHFLILWPLGIVGILSGDIATYYQSALPNWLAVGLGLGFLGSLAYVLPWWDSHGGKYSLEWLWQRLLVPSVPRRQDFLHGKKTLHL